MPVAGDATLAAPQASLSRTAHSDLKSNVLSKDEGRNLSISEKTGGRTTMTVSDDSL